MKNEVTRGWKGFKTLKLESSWATVKVSFSLSDDFEMQKFMNLNFFQTKSIETWKPLEQKELVKH